MTLIHFDLRNEIAAAGYEPTDGELQCSYAHEIEVDGEPILLTTKPFIVPLVAGEGSADIYPTPPGNGLEVHVWGGRQPFGVRARTVAIPDSPTVVEFTDLDELDPDTLADPVLYDAIAREFAALTGRIETIETDLPTSIEEAVSALVDGSPGTLDTLNEIAAALGDDDDFAGTMTTLLAGKASVGELASEEDARTGADSALAASIAAVEDVLPTKADLVGGTIPDAQIPATITRDTELSAAIAALVDSSPATLDTLSELAAALGADPNFATTITNALAGKASTAQLEAEGLLARNADNLTGGTVADARIPSSITRDSEVAALVAAELAAYQPGLEIGYAERVTSATSTQTAPNATGTISLLSVTVVGAGRPVDIRFQAALAFHSVANRPVFTSLMVNGGASGAAAADTSPSTSSGPSHTFTRRMVLTAGVSYTFTVAIYTDAGGGTATVFANATYPMSLSVTNR